MILTSGLQVLKNNFASLVQSVEHRCGMAEEGDRNPWEAPRFYGCSLVVEHCPRRAGCWSRVTNPCMTKETRGSIPANHTKIYAVLV